MRYIVIVLILFAVEFNIFGQEVSPVDEGSVSYITSQNVYVKFNSTENISIGDTLFRNNNGQKSPMLVVTNISSISCVCVPILGAKLEVGNKILYKNNKRKVKETSKKTTNIEEATVASTQPEPSNKEDKDVKITYPIAGKLSVSSYSDFSNTDGGNNQRMRYTFSLNAKNIGGSKFSTDTYISFVHKNDNWDEISKDIFYGLKIYSLSATYEPTETMKITLGRQINPSISNIGAIDGLQFAKGFKDFTLGAFAGSRPSTVDYSFDFSLPQFGAYLNHNYNGKHGNMGNTIAFVNQTNNWQTDRRFVYFQHSNSLINKLYFFGSVQMELYQKIDGVAKNTFNLNNLYLMFRYKVMRQLSLSFSYRSQANMIYYETYKSYVDELLAKATVEGYRFQVNYRPTHKISIGLRASYRAAKQDPKPTKTLYGYVAFSNVLNLNFSTVFSATILETSYLSGKIYSVAVTKDIVPGKLQGRVGYKYVDYKFVNYDASLGQNIGDIDLTWRIMKRLSFTASYEGIFESVNSYSRLYLNLIKRF